MKQEYLNFNREEMRNFLKEQYEPGTVVKAICDDGMMLWIVMPGHLTVQVIYDDYSVANLSNGTYKSYIYDFHDLTGKENWSFEEIN